jgi:hypothetical protein
MPGTVAQPTSGLGGGGASQLGGVSPVAGMPRPASTGGQRPKGSELAAIVVGAAAEKQPKEKQQTTAMSPTHAHRDREPTTIQSRAATVGL